MKPQDYLKALTTAGYKIKVTKLKDTAAPGTIQTRTIAKYTAIYKTKGHIITITGTTHQIGNDIHTTAKLLTTSTIRQHIAKLQTSSITPSHTTYLTTLPKIANKLPACQDYTPIQKPTSTSDTVLS